MRIIALAVWPVFFMVTFYLFKKARLSIFNSTYSNLGSNKKYGTSFNATLIISGLLQFVFLFLVLMSYLNRSALVGIVGLGCLMLTTLAGIFSGLITEDEIKRFIK